MKLKVYPILDNPMFPVVSPDHPLAGQKRIPISALSQERFLTREKGSGSRKAIEDHLSEAGISLQSTMEMGSSETIKQGVMAGLGVSILSRFSMALELATGCLVSLDMETFPIVRTWCLVHPLDKRLSPAAQAFVDYILAHDEQVKQLINNRFLGVERPG